jgi:hypothetical protein
MSIENGIEGCYCEPRPIAASALEAANRIIHGDGTENDSQLVAGVLIQLVDEVVKS